MAEAIFAVLREGLSLSQAARKFDIPYPTFVLYANRVHNMLGPSADGSSGNGKFFAPILNHFSLIFKRKLLLLVLEFPYLLSYYSSNFFFLWLHNLLK